eukprot:CAMPEP_0197701934 /NCGR_PEP_ID=MMETSP1338-20131121/123877_1 /TAXON_ID=43686 ORGANISM="Pelagodinium beii, Strain RCC1491" /NCGR_SAMPLE_ID=MMETSP1338 /ASSEMBLY_ACC=CAM_ASM_000754 /LENGTH=180 /DNA_ID=CAMNT_0043285695 /DNA_START=26 /DNA_END=564 /DNA_ORIENTATION=+
MKMKHDLVETVSGFILKAEKQSLAGFQEQDLSTLTWGFASLRLRDESLFNAIGLEVAEKLPTFSLPGIVCTLWSFASLRVTPSFLDMAIHHLKFGRLADKLEPRGCSMLLWSLATLRSHGPDVELFYYHLAERCILPRVQRFHGQDISNCLWAFATARIQHEATFTALARQSLPAMSGFT